MIDTPKLIEGGIAVDDRGQISFINAFRFKGVKRFYVVSNHKANFTRAWHSHKLGAEYVFVTKGAVKVCAVKIEGDWEKPSKDTEVFQEVLSERKPAILYIPSGYANGYMTLTEDTQVMFFSTLTLEKTLKDDFRFPVDYWDAWSIEER